MKTLYRIFLILLVIGGLNRGLFAWFDLNLVAKIFPNVATTITTNWVDVTSMSMNTIAKAIYSLVTLGAIWVFIANLWWCSCCKKD